MSTWFRFKESLSGLRPSPPTYLPADYPDLSGKYFLITGSSAGVGKEASKLLLAQNVTLVMVNRNPEKTSKVIDEIKAGLMKEKEFTAQDLDKRIISVQADLSDLKTIKSAAKKVLESVPQLDGVVLNAGLMQPPNGSKTAQGYELQFGSNVMGHQLLLELITPAVLQSAELGNKPRVVFTSSLAHIHAPDNGGLTWNFSDASQSSKFLIYGQSKAGNIYQAAHYGKKYADKGVTTSAVHPGLLVSELQRHLPSVLTTMFGTVMYPAVYGAYSELFGALSPEVGAKGPGYAGYIVAFGTFRDARPDIAAGCDDGTADKMIEWIDKEIEQYK